MRIRLAPTIGALLLAAASLGCDSPGQVTGLLATPSNGQVQVRMLNALTASQSLSFVVDQQVATSGVGFGGASPYVPMAIGTHRLQAEGTTTGTTLVDFTRDLNTEGSFSFIPAPGLSQSAALFIADDPTPVSGQAKVRVVHRSMDSSSSGRPSPTRSTRHSAPCSSRRTAPQRWCSATQKVSRSSFTRSWPLQKKRASRFRCWSRSATSSPTRTRP